MRLRTIFNTSAVSLGIIASVGAALLFLLMQQQQTTRKGILNSFETSNIAREIELVLTRHQRDNYFFKTMGTSKYLERRVESRKRLEELATKLRNASDSPTQKIFSEAVIVSIDSYLSEYEELKLVDKTPYKVYSELSEPASIAREQIGELLEFNKSSIEQIRRDIRYDEKIAASAGYLITFMIPVATLLILSIWRMLVYRPLFKTNQSIKNFRMGPKPFEPLKFGAVEIKDLSNAFYDLTVRLESEQKERHRFLASVAHDLKNPLGAIQMAIEEITTDPHISESEKLQMLAIIQRQSSALSFLVEDLLLATTLDAGKLKISPTTLDIRKCVLDVTALLAKSTTKHTLDVVVPPYPVLCRVDAARLIQILHNLISNALKYSPQGGDISIRVERQSNQATISITDTGIGISQEELAHIFEPFHRGSQDGSLIKGLGLGLSNAKKLIDAMNGHLVVESKVGKGSEFSMTFPLYETPQYGLRLAFE